MGVRKKGVATNLNSLVISICMCTATNIRKEKNHPQGDPSLDTLAQLRHFNQKGIKSLRKRARAKYLTDHIIFYLNNQQDNTLKNSYWNSYHCAKVIQQEGGKLTAKYCNNRWCMVCNRIRTAKAIRGYLPQIEKMGDPRFVTLTRPNVKAEELEQEIEDLVKAMRLLTKQMRVTANKPLYGLRKLEVTYNHREDTYHPHFHLIIEGEEVAHEAIERWLKMNPTASYKAQDERPIETPHHAIELFKYFTKVATKVRKKGVEVLIIHAPSLNIIFKAMRGKRVLQPIGGMRKVNVDVEEIRSEVYEELEQEENLSWIYDTPLGDWIDRTTGETLTGYTPSDKFRKWIGTDKFEGKYTQIEVENAYKDHTK